MLLLVLAAAAATTLAPNSTLISDGRPPERFQDDKRIVVEFTNQRGIDQACHPRFGTPPAGMKTNACATGRKVIVPNPCDYPATETFAHLMCHELAHMNGWPTTHGD